MKQIIVELKLDKTFFQQSNLIQLETFIHIKLFLIVFFLGFEKTLKIPIKAFNLEYKSLNESLKLFRYKIKPRFQVI